jgi:2-polyprenyl-6-hydroxyphenyl methylase / 3-demethylubiquinone-9 3-methyltransferase
VPADNGIYNAPGDIWWADDQPMSVIRTALNPVRLRYLTKVLGQSDVNPVGKVLADIGCGGGLFAEELARLGADVIGVDPSAPSLETARSCSGRWPGD